MQKNRRYFKVRREAHEIRRYRRAEDLAVLRLDPYTKTFVDKFLKRTANKLRSFKQNLFY